MISFQFSTLQIGALLLASTLILTGVCLALPSLLHLVRAARGPLERLTPRRFRLGTRLALDSLMARPRQTLSALVPLVIAVAIVIAAATAAGTANASITRVANARFPCDIEVLVGEWQDMARLRRALDRLPSVQATTPILLGDRALRDGDRVFAEPLHTTPQSDYETYQQPGRKGPPLAANEIHLSPAGAERLGLRDGQTVDVHLSPAEPSPHQLTDDPATNRRKALAALTWDSGKYQTYQVKVLDHQPVINLLLPAEAPQSNVSKVCVRLTDPPSLAASSEVREAIRTFVLPESALRDIASELYSQQLSIHRMLLFSTLLAAVATAVAFIGVANTLISSALSRRPQIATLEILGMSRTQLWTMFVVEGIVLSLVGIGVGIATGIVLGLLTVSALAGSTQWLAVTVPWAPVMLCFLIAIGGGLFGALAAGWQTLRPTPEGSYPQG